MKTTYTLHIAGFEKSETHPYGYEEIGYGKDWNFRQAKKEAEKFRGKAVSARFHKNGSDIHCLSVNLEN